MNNAANNNYNDDLNAFRSGLSAEHQQFSAGLASKANSYMSNLANVKQDFAGKLGEAKSHLENAQELLKSGFESEAGIAGGAIAAKAVVHLKRVVQGTHDYRGNLTEKGKQVGRDALNQNEEGAPESNEAGNMPKETAGPEGGSNTGIGADSGGGRELDFKSSQTHQNQFTRDGYDENTGLKTDPQQVPNQGETKTGESKSNIDDLTAEDDTSTPFDFEGDGMDLTKAKMPSSSLSDIADAAKSGGDDIVSGLGSGAENVASKVGLDVAEDAGKAGIDSVLDAAAAAFSWVPFVGEVLTGAAAVAGIATAIVGGVDTIRDAANEASVEAQAKAGIASAVAARPVTQAENYAGGFVAPSASSIQT